MWLSWKFHVWIETKKRKEKKKWKFKIANSQIADNQNVRAANFLYVISTWLASEETQTDNRRGKVVGEGQEGGEASWAC